MIRGCLLWGLVVGCGPQPSAFTQADGEAPGDASVPRDTFGTDTRVAPVPVRDGGASACSEAAQLVYVLSDRNELYSFRPNLRRFTRIGALRCPTAWAPNSMAIDRSAVAWVNYVDSSLGDTAGALYRVNTTDASCTAAPPVPLPRSWFRLGMGFATASADSAEETLFVAATPDPFAGPSQGLARVDVTTGALTPVGAFSGQLRGQSAELTGTGDGRLFGFFTTNPVQVAQLNRTTGAVESSQSIHGLATPQAWAFSFWGGDFYLYTAPSALTGRTSNVTRYRPSDGSVDLMYMSELGFRIVGAGVSTCAPITPPP
jgi:hypothetical protein